jgi:hypothetical protein
MTDTNELRREANKLQGFLDRQGQKKEPYDLFYSTAFYEKHPEQAFYPVYPESVADGLKTTIANLLRTANYLGATGAYLQGWITTKEYEKRMRDG